MNATSPAATACLDTPIGPVTVTATPAGIIAVAYGGRPVAPPPASPPCLEAALVQLAEYFAGRRTVFDLPLMPRGTAFQTVVWTKLAAIPFGATLSYRHLAAALGAPRAVRAIGAANGRNPLNIIIPCHRVLGADGSLTGYSGGLERKRWLLDHEQRVLAAIAAPGA